MEDAWWYGATHASARIALIAATYADARDTITRAFGCGSWACGELGGGALTKLLPLLPVQWFHRYSKALPEIYGEENADFENTDAARD